MEGAVSRGLGGLVAPNCDINDRDGQDVWREENGQELDLDSRMVSSKAGQQGNVAFIAATAMSRLGQQKPRGASEWMDIQAACLE